MYLIVYLYKKAYRLGLFYNHFQNILRILMFYQLFFYHK